MTDQIREQIARRFRELLDRKMFRKKALLTVRQEFGNQKRLLGYVSVYRYCKKFGISTK